MKYFKSLHDTENRIGLAGARYTKWIASLELRHKEHNNDSYPLHNNTIDFTQKNETIVHILTWYIEHHP